MIDIVGPLGLSHEAKQFQYTGRKGILGLYADSIVNRYLDELKLPWAVKEYGPFNMDFSTKYHMNGWKGAKEKTSSSLSGLHFGHYIACAFDPNLAAMDASLDSFAAKTGHSYPRWKHGINVMLQKKPGETRVTKLRTILLYEADFNKNNKLMGKDMMRFAEKYDLLAPEQYGSRKYHSAQDQSLNKALTFDLYRQL